MEKLLQNIEKYLLYATLFLLPITALPISPNPYVVPKLAVLAAGVGLILLVRAFRVLVSGKLEFSIGTFDFPLIVLAASFVLSTILRTPNKMEALLLPGTTTAALGGILLYFLINQLKAREKEIVSMVLVASAFVFAGIMVVSFSGVLDSLAFWPGFLKAPNFSPEGGFLPSTIFLAAVLPLAVGVFLSHKDASKKVFFGAAAGVIAFGVLVSLYNLLPGRPYSPRFPSLATSWAITIDSLKESPVLGVGPGNYTTAFNRFRPISYNATDLWAIRFSSASNFFFTTLTELGLLGMAALLLILYSVYKLASKRFAERQLSGGIALAEALTFIAFILLVASAAFFPATNLLVVLLFVLLSLNSKAHESSLNLTTQAAGPAVGFASATSQRVGSRLPAILVTLPVFVLIILAGVQGGKFLLAEYKFKRSLDFIGQNKAKETYDLMREAINLNPQVDRYHAAFTQINIAIANSLAQKGKDLTDADRNLITQLIQQAIRDARATVTLNPTRSGNWEILGGVYRAVIPLAKGADSFAIQSYSQAVALDPINPNLRINLGGIYYSQKDYDTASRVLELAVISKPDLANSHYNLAFAYRDKGEIEKAYQQVTLVLSLITDKSSKDYTTAKSVLEDLEKKRPPKAAQSGENLTPPQGQPAPTLEPPLQLPAGSEPPQGQVSPAPSAAPSASPTP